MAMSTGILRFLKEEGDLGMEKRYVIRFRQRLGFSGAAPYEEGFDPKSTRGLSGERRRLVAAYELNHFNVIKR